MKTSLIVVLVWALAGCSSTPPAATSPAAVAASAAPASAPVPRGGGVQLLKDYPTATAYENLGIVDYTFFRPGLRTPSLVDVMPDLKAKVQDFGGNAFIVRQRAPDRDDKRKLRVSVEVLKLP
jgi:hypothetical protein